MSIEAKRTAYENSWALGKKCVFGEKWDWSMECVGRGGN
jgi:hypothetical protein